MSPQEQLPELATIAQVWHLAAVLEDIHRGRILFPRFGRPLVWPKEMRLSLLHSILEGIPVGSIMVWRTRTVEVAVMGRLGPFRLPAVDQEAPYRRYLIDGEQRLMTLYFALFGSVAADEAERSGEILDAFKAYYDLREEKFVTRDDLAEVLPYHLPLTALLQGSHLTSFQRNLSKRPEEEGSSAWYDVSKVAELLLRSDQVAHAFRDYALPMISITSENLEIVTRTFQLVHTQHVAMSQVNLVNALTWSPTFDFFEQLQRTKQGPLADLGWGEIEDQIILRVCKAILDLGVYDEDSEAVSQALKKSPRILTETEVNLCAVASFLRAACGIRSPDLVPYSAQIVALAVAFREVPTPAKAARALLRDWVWLTTYAEVFTGIAGSRFSQLLDDTRSLARGKALRPMAGKQRPQRRPLGRFDFRHARARGLALLLASRAPRDPAHPEREATRIRARKLLAEHGARAMAQLVSSSMATPEISSRAGARVLLAPESVQTMRKLLQGAPPLEFLESHVISQEAYRAFKAGDHARFVLLREEDLNRIEGDRFSKVLERLYPSNDAT